MTKLLNLMKSRAYALTCIIIFDIMFTIPYVQRLEVSIMIYTKLKGIMREKGYSQKMLADSIGLTPRSLNAKLNGRTQFTVYEAYVIAQVLDIANPAECFFNGYSAHAV